MDEAEEAGRKPYQKLSGDERERFLAALRRTGNRKYAAAAIGVEPRLMDQRREHDPELDRDWAAAVEEAHRRLAAAAGPFDIDPDPSSVAPEQGPLDMIRRGKKGRLQIVSAGEGRWNGLVEHLFKEVLRETGNFAAAARAVGFSEGAVWERRRKWPAFAEELEKVLEEAELKLEFRAATMGNNVIAAVAQEERAGDADADSAPGDSPPTPPPFDLDQAMRFLRWREEKRRGRGKRGPQAPLPSIDSVTDKILRQVDAIEQHRRREEATGEDEGEDHV